MSTGLESELTDPVRFLPNPNVFPEADDAESREDSMDGNGSRSLSRLRISNGGGVRDLCKGDAAYECGWNGRCEAGGGKLPD